MAILLDTRTGPVNQADGAGDQPLRQDRTGALAVVDAHGRYQEANSRGTLYSAMNAGAGQTLVAANLFSTAIATFQPITLIYNPIGNAFKFAIQQAWCSVSTEVLATGAQSGAMLWVVNANQIITNASSVTPVSCSTLKAFGSTAVIVNNAVLAGAAGNPTLLRPVSGTISLVTATANASLLSGLVYMEDVGGSIIVPPGAYAGFANSISATVGAVTAGLTWEEILV